MDTKTRYMVIVLLGMVSIPAMAQCAMCRAVLESGESDQAAKSVNDGIVYLMIIPYLLMAGVGYYLYKSKRKKK